jgi:hypothetical protein
VVPSAAADGETAYAGHHDMASKRFPIRLGARSRPLLRLFGVSGPSDAWVELRDDALEARFGWASAATPVSNIARWRIEGPWLWITAIGVRRSIRHGDITFGGSHHGGVRLDFRERVAVGPFRVPALYVTVNDLEGFAAALAERGITGRDARKRVVP